MPSRPDRRATLSRRIRAIQVRTPGITGRARQSDAMAQLDQVIAILLIDEQTTPQHEGATIGAIPGLVERLSPCWNGRARSEHPRPRLDIPKRAWFGGIRCSSFISSSAESRRSTANLWTEAVYIRGTRPPRNALEATQTVSLAFWAGAIANQRSAARVKKTNRKPTCMICLFSREWLPLTSLENVPPRIPAAELLLWDELKPVRQRHRLLALLGNFVGFESIKALNRLARLGYPRTFVRDLHGTPAEKVEVVMP